LGAISIDLFLEFPDCLRIAFTQAMKVREAEHVLASANIQQGEFSYPWGSALNAIPVDESSFIYRGVLGERNEVRAVHPDFGAIVYLHFGSLVVDDDDSIVYIGNGVQTAWLHFAVRHAASSSLAHELPDDN